MIIYRYIIISEGPLDNKSENLQKRWMHTWFFIHIKNLPDWNKNCEAEVLIYWGPDASLDTHIESFDQLWRLWQLWPYRQNGHIRDMAIVAINAIVEPGHWNEYLKKRLDLTIATSEADFV